MASSELDLAKIGQVGIVVRDLQAAIEGYSRAFGIGPWRIHSNSAPPLRCTYRGRPASYKVRLAMAQAGPITIEMIQYLEGDTIHRDFLAEGREGLEHLGVYVPDLDAALAIVREKGVNILQQADGLGIKGDGRYAYLDTAASLGTVLELIQPASERFPPEAIYP